MRYFIKAVPVPSRSLDIYDFLENMGRVYVRKTTRASFSEEALAEAMQKVISREMGTNEASRAYGISSRTLRRHLIAKSSKVRLGRCPEIGIEHERRLVLHIKALERVGFAPDATSVKKMAFSFAEKLHLNHRFSREAKSAGDDWFQGFLRRNRELSIRKSEGLSLARATGMNRTDVSNFFTLLRDVIIKNNLLNKPDKIFNVDETGIQINNKPGKVVATKGTKDVYSLTTSERGENISLVSCCNAEGYFLPPVLIFKGKNKKDEFLDGLPPGSGPNKAQPSTSFSPGHTNMGVSDMSTDSQTSNEASEVSLNLEEKETPSKFLREDNPIPLIPNTIPKRKQHALELTSPENRRKKKQAQDKKDKRKKPSENEKKIRRKACVKQVKRKQNVSSSSSSETEPHFSSSEDLSDDTDDYCLECREYYYTTKSKVDWIQCEACSKWLHETCTNHTNINQVMSTEITIASMKLPCGGSKAPISDPNQTCESTML
ncbi:unnamed protein product [Acanthoscelides obtectus]|uniref:HTH psq-type domain-containing protein n=1 Tax=Acanthoscelides obtectus TaxID=200917 RepID=A0A9P0JKR9_ACAOB|nr:unnamed protein product [Acanthoscelides obtectus]CAK1665740.1 hypothetical protein AOBTE_LOCUS24945 [Acanthoscelides obtectus]